MKYLLFTLLPTLMLAQNIQVTPSNPSVNAGGTVSIQTDRPVVFRLQGAGALSSTKATTTTFNAPASAPPQHVLDGCMVLPSDSVFNTRIDNLPLVPTSSAWANGTLIVPISLGYNWGTNVVDHTTPTQPYDFLYTSAINGTPFPNLPLWNRKREEGSYVTDGTNDHHVMMINHENCQFYELYHDIIGSVPANAVSGYTYNSTNYQQPVNGTTDAASMPLTALVLHLSEIKAGVVKHALRFPACVGCVSHSYVWPAMYSTGWQPGAAPMGSRFRLKSSFDISSFPPSAQVVLTALKQYGMILADLGGTGQITASTDVTEDQQVTRELATIPAAQIPASAWEVVDESSLMLNANLNVVNPNNGYVKPANQAVLTIIDAANPANTVTVPIAIQPVLVGMPDPALVIQSGTNPFPLPYWVNNASNQQVRWTMGAGAVGSVSASGVYTAPPNVTAPVSFPITATSVQDPSASATVSVTVIPAGVIRIDSGSPTATVDENGNTWLPDMALETATFATLNDNYPSYGWGKIPYLTQTESFIYTWGDDIEYRLHVPNGQYTVSIIQGQGACSGTFTPLVNDNGLLMGPMGIQIQNQLAQPAWNFIAQANYQCRVPVTVNAPATVTDTSLRVNVRALGGDNQHSPPVVNGLIITPQSKPVMQIDTKGQTSIQAGQSLTLGILNWYGPAVPPIWSIQGPGSISQSGVYTAPTASAGTSVNITVMNPLYHVKAQATLTIPASY